MSHWIFTLENLFKLIIRPLEWVMLVAVIGGGVFLLVHSKGIPLLKLKSAFRLLFLKEKAQGISRFQALSAVLAATVGLGNI
jgi:AGCS family alanine or glycine:cation symporter